MKCNYIYFWGGKCDRFCIELFDSRGEFTSSEMQLCFIVRVSVHKHTLKVIATDGIPVQPEDVDAITYFPGSYF